MTEISEKVAEHYNNLQEKGLDERTKSRIFYMRNLNNWIKSMLIGEYVRKAHQKRRGQMTVLDIGCGKGGDLLKWKKGDIDYIVCADIAGTSIEQCEKRYQDLWHRSNYERRSQRRFRAEFLTADCTKTRLKPLYRNKDMMFDIVSCQFAFHYCFESIEQVEQMMQNISECLKPGGFFIGSTPDSFEIMKRLKESDGNSFGNEVYKIEFEDKENLPLFGAQYNFYLDGVVDCPEFLVYFPLLVEVAKKHNLKLIFKKKFDEYFWECIKHSDRYRKDDARQLLGRMQALETYPAFEGNELMSKNEDDYKHAKEELQAQKKEDNRDNSRIGTLSLAEWAAVTLYVVFAFEKIDPNATEKPKEEKDKVDESTGEEKEKQEESEENGDVSQKRKHESDDDDDASEPKKSQES